MPDADADEAGPMPSVYDPNFIAAEDAIQRNDLPALRRMVAEIPALVHQRNPDSDGILLHDTASYGTPEAADLLCHAGADPNAQDWDGDTPLWVAARWSREPEFVDVLLRHGADLELGRGDDELSTPLQAATSWGDDRLPFARRLVECGARVDLASGFRLYGFRYLKEQIESDPSVLQRFPHKERLLSDAISRRSVEAVELLLKHGLSAKTSHHRTPVIFDAFGCDINPLLIRILLEHGADPNARMSSGTSLLEYAARGPDSEISVPLLLQAGAFPVETPNPESRS